MKRNIFICLYFIIAFHSIGLSCYIFSGNNARVTLPLSTFIKLDNSDFTIDMYVFGNEESTTNTVPLLSNRGTTASGLMIGFHEKVDDSKYKMLFIQYDGIKYMHKNNGDYNAKILGTGCHQVSVSLLENKLSMYVDGILLGTHTIPKKISIASAIPILLGFDKATNTNFGGHISHVRFWNKGKTQDEVKRDLKAITDPTGLICYWPLINQAESVVELVNDLNGFLGTSPTNYDNEPEFYPSCCLDNPMILPIEPNAALWFDGLTDFVRITDNDFIHHYDLENMTFEFLFSNSNESTGEFPIISTRTSLKKDGLYVGLIKAHEDSLAIKIETNDSLFIVESPAISAILKTSLCTHTALVFSYDDLIIYINGKKIKTINYKSSLRVMAGPAMVVGHDYFTNAFFKGTISQVRVWQRKLSELEVSNSMNKKISFGNDIGVEALMNYKIKQYVFNNFTSTGMTLGVTQGDEDSDPTIIEELCELSTGVNDENEKQHLSISIFPNPNNGYFEFAHPINDMSMTIYNALGKVVCHQHIDQSKVNVNLIDGLYYLTLIDKLGHKYSSKMVVKN